jgi:RNA polymerase sigma factor (sigma-70 family)
MNHQELEHIWDKYFPRVYGYFYKRITNRSDVEDLSSITMTALFIKLSKSDIENIEGYLWQIARTQLCLFIRKKKSIPIMTEIIAELFIDDQSFLDIQHQLTKKQLLVKINKLAEQHLKTDEQQLLNLAYKQNLNSTQIAKITDIKPATIRKKLTRAIAKLKLHIPNL